MNIYTYFETLTLNNNVCFRQVHQDGGVDGQRRDGDPEGVRQQGLHLGRVQEGEGQLPVPLQEPRAG